MSPTVLPLISEADYPHFQRIIAELQQVSYAEWRDDHDKATAYRRTRNGSVDIRVLPGAFDSWLKASDQAAHLELLWVYAETHVVVEVSVRAGAVN